MRSSALTASVVRTAPLEVAEAYSGARLEWAELADGQRVVLKHLPAEGDWLTRATDGAGRTQRLWRGDLYGPLDPVVDHGLLGIEDWGDHDVVVMADLSDRLWPAATPIDPAQAGELLAGLARFHDLGAQLVGRLDLDEIAGCPVGARYGMFTPDVHRHDNGPNPHPVRDLLVDSWCDFAELIDAEVLAVIGDVHRDPDALGRRILARAGDSTVLHGDPKPENLGVAGGRLTAIDWGELTGFGPREVDVAWFALTATRSRLDLHPTEVADLYERTSGTPLNRDVLGLAWVGSLAQWGFRLAATARRSRHEEARQKAATRLGWWTELTRSALEAGLW